MERSNSIFFKWLINDKKKLVLNSQILKSVSIKINAITDTKLVLSSYYYILLLSEHLSDSFPLSVDTV